MSALPDHLISGLDDCDNLNDAFEVSPLMRPDQLKIMPVLVKTIAAP